MKRISVLSVGVVVAAVLATGAAGASAAPVGGLPTLALTLTGNAITATSSVPAGAVNVVSTVSGEAQGSPTIVHLDPGVTFRQAFAAAAAAHGDANALQGLASIIMAPLANKGTSSVQTVLTPGNYVALDTEKGNPAKWPVANFTVTPSASPAALPPAQATVATQEFRILSPKTLHDGQTVRFVNRGFLVHMVIAFPVRSRAAAKKVTALLLAGHDRKAMRLIAGPPVGYVGTFSPGGIQQQTISAKPGTYIFACFMDTQDGREHTQLGMETTVQITK